MPRGARESGIRAGFGILLSVFLESRLELSEFVERLKGREAVDIEGPDGVEDRAGLTLDDDFGLSMRSEKIELRPSIFINRTHP